MPLLTERYTPLAFTSGTAEKRKLVDVDFELTSDSRRKNPVLKRRTKSDMQKTSIPVTKPLQLKNNIEALARSQTSADRILPAVPPSQSIRFNGHGKVPLYSLSSEETIGLSNAVLHSEYFHTSCHTRPIKREEWSQTAAIPTNPPLKLKVYDTGNELSHAIAADNAIQAANTNTLPEDLTFGPALCNEREQTSDHHNSSERGHRSMTCVYKPNFLVAAVVSQDISVVRHTGTSPIDVPSLRTHKSRPAIVKPSASEYIKLSKWTRKSDVISETDEQAFNLWSDSNFEWGCGAIQSVQEPSNELVTTECLAQTSAKKKKHALLQSIESEPDRPFGNALVNDEDVKSDLEKVNSRSWYNFRPRTKRKTTEPGSSIKKHRQRTTVTVASMTTPNLTVDENFPPIVSLHSSLPSLPSWASSPVVPENDNGVDDVCPSPLPHSQSQPDKSPNTIESTPQTEFQERGVFDFSSGMQILS
eukprot:CFRG0041T1